MQVKLIAAVGQNGQLHTPWRDEEYLAKFKRTTMGGVVVVGYRTAKLLPIMTGRVVCIMERGEDPEEIIQRYAGRTIWVSGGASTFEIWRPFVEQAVITFTHSEKKADATMPPLWLRPRPNRVPSVS